ncbi:growth/differentiation factor 8-like [Lineus longissimus]|uniref:growth/differentiation factor 8-like n=1 Tax=Lineus longissimus TaxID=88925 RepID=UPI002B4EB4AA
MAVAMQIPVIFFLVSLTLIHYGQAHSVRHVTRDNRRSGRGDSVFKTLRQSPQEVTSRREHLQRESTTSDGDVVSQPGLENEESARRQLMDSALGPEVSNGHISVRVRNGRIRSMLAKGSMVPTDDDDDWLENGDGVGTGVDKTVGELSREVEIENARATHPAPSVSVIDSQSNQDGYDLPVEDDSAEVTQIHRPPKKCAHCWMREEVKQLRIESIKTQILQKLRLSAPPNITKEKIPNVPDRHPLHGHLNKFGVQADDPTERLGSEVGAEDMYKYEDYYVNTVKSINFGEKPPSRIGNNSQICYFTFKDDVMKARIEKAKLWVYLRDGGRMTGPNAKTLILVYQRFPPSTPGGPVTRRLIDRKEIHPPPRGLNWHHFNIRDVVEEWTLRPETNYGLYIEATDHIGKMLPVIVPNTEAESNYKPFVDLKIRDMSSNRQKRMLSRTCQEDDVERNCCRFPLRISFEDFGWDWVIAPKSYTANYCSGECPYVYAQDYQHTHLVQQAVPRNATICCTPRKMHALSMIYFADALNVVYGKVPEMVVESCGCA